MIKINESYELPNIRSINFNKKPISISPNYRSIYKIYQLCLILSLNSYRKTASLLKLHFFSWMMSSNKKMEQMKSFVENDFKGDIPVWRNEPSLNRAIAFAVAEGIFCSNRGKFKLTNKGDKIVEEILKDEGLLKEDKKFLYSIGRTISENKLDSIVKSWGEKYRVEV